MSILASLLAARPGSDLDFVWIVIVLAISAVGWVVGKIMEAEEAKKRKGARIPPPAEVEPDEEEELIIPTEVREDRPPLPRPQPKSPPTMPRVPRIPQQPAPQRMPTPIRVERRPEVRRPTVPPPKRPASPPPRPVPVGRQTTRPAGDRVTPAQDASRLGTLAERHTQKLADREAKIEARRETHPQTTAAKDVVQASTPARKFGLTASTLRKAIILNEILSPPLAIRQDDPFELKY